MASKIRDRIVASAIRCFALKGYHGCSTKEIASRANVTEGSLFRLFSSKEKLFAEALSVSLRAKKMRKTYLRVIAFAVLEGTGCTDANHKAFESLAKRHPLLRELRTIDK